MNEFMKSPNIMKRVTIREYYPQVTIRNYLQLSRLIYLSAFAYPSDSTRTTVGNVKEQAPKTEILISKLRVLTCSLVIIMYISHPFFQNLLINHRLNN